MALLSDDYHNYETSLEQAQRLDIYLKLWSSLWKIAFDKLEVEWSNTIVKNEGVYPICYPVLLLSLMHQIVVHRTWVFPKRTVKSFKTSKTRFPVVQFSSFNCSAYFQGFLVYIRILQTCSYPKFGTLRSLNITQLTHKLLTKKRSDRLFLRD